VTRPFTDQNVAFDLAEFVKRGAAGITLVYGGGMPTYHTVRDSVANTDPASVQQQGEYAVALARDLGALDFTVPPRTGDGVYFTLWPDLVVHYTTTTALVLGIAVVVTTVAGRGCGGR
jgi:hypothetical protein